MISPLSYALTNSPLLLSSPSEIPLLLIHKPLTQRYPMGVEKSEPHFLQEEVWGFFNDSFLKSSFWHFPSG
jgi:hypothetical protein